MKSGKILWSRGAGTAVKVTVMVALLCLSCLLTYFVAFFFSGDEGEFSEAVHIDEKAELPVIIIDAGHGGIDGGAISPDGNTEKEINLSVARRLYALFRASGIDCVMTRSEDKMLADESMKRGRKMTDLKNRLAILEEISNSGREAVFISIHMNNFSEPEYFGLQVWYSPNHARSKILAEAVQNYTKKWLDTKNKREVKKATSEIYLLDRATSPAILVECGFLSNPEECGRLSTDQYRNELAATIFSAICRGITN